MTKSDSGRSPQPVSNLVPETGTDSDGQVTTWGMETQRKAKADRYFAVHLNNQRSWYSHRSNHSRIVTQRLSIAVLGAGALVSIIQVFPSGLWAQLITALLGGAVVIAKGLEQIWGHEGSWVGYRKASEAMKHHYRIYINNAGGYEDQPDEDQAFRAFVENIEFIIAEESMQYWQRKEDRNMKATSAARQGRKGSSKTDG